MIASHANAEGEPEQRVTNTVEVSARPVTGGGTPVVDAVTPNATDNRDGRHRRGGGGHDDGGLQRAGERTPAARPTPT